MANEQGTEPDLAKTVAYLQATQKQIVKEIYDLHNSNMDSVIFSRLRGMNEALMRQSDQINVLIALMAEHKMIRGDSSPSTLQRRRARGNEDFIREAERICREDIGLNYVNHQSGQGNSMLSQGIEAVVIGEEQ